VFRSGSTSMFRGQFVTRTLVVLPLALVGCTSGWRRIESAECGFAVRMPGEPSVARRVLNTSRGTIEFQWLRLEVPRNVLRSQTFINFFQAGCAVLPNALDDTDGRREVERSVAQEIGPIQARRIVTIGFQPAIELDIKADRVTYVVRLLFQRGRVYQLLAAKSGNILLRGTEATFFDSFELVP